MALVWDQVLETVRSRNAGLAGRTPPGPNVIADIEHAEEALGRALPESFREFMRRVGSTIWPTTVLDVQAVAAHWQVSRTNLPEHLVPFADEGRGIVFAFDTRQLFDNEYPVVPVRRGEPIGLSPTPSTAGGGFPEWLADQIDEQTAIFEDGRTSERLARIKRLLKPYVSMPPRFCPTERDLARVERDLGFRLPEEYRRFTCWFGAVDWPIRVVDALDIDSLRPSLSLSIPDTQPNAFTPVAADRQGSFFGFPFGSSRIAILTRGGLARTGRSFFDWLEEFANERLAVSRRGDGKTREQPGFLVRKREKIE